MILGCILIQHFGAGLLLADAGLRKLRAAIFRGQSLANLGAVLSLLDGPSGCDPAFYVVWFRFRMLRRFLAYRVRFPGFVGFQSMLLVGALVTVLQAMMGSILGLTILVLFGMLAASWMA